MKKASSRESIEQERTSAFIADIADLFVVSAVTTGILIGIIDNYNPEIIGNIKGEINYIRSLQIILLCGSEALIGLKYSKFLIPTSISLMLSFANAICYYDSTFPIETRKLTEQTYSIISESSIVVLGICTLILAYELIKHCASKLSNIIHDNAMLK